MLTHTWQTVNFQDVQVSFSIHSHVYPGTVETAEGVKGFYGNFLRIGGYFFINRGRTDNSHIPTGTACLVFIGINVWTSFTKNQFGWNKGIGRAVAQNADIDLSPGNILFCQNRLLKLIKDNAGRFAEFFLIVDNADAKGDGLVFRLNDQGEC